MINHDWFNCFTTNYVFCCFSNLILTSLILYYLSNRPVLPYTFLGHFVYMLGVTQQKLLLNGHILNAGPISYGQILCMFFERPYLHRADKPLLFSETLPRILCFTLQYLVLFEDTSLYWKIDFYTDQLLLICC